MKPSLQQLRSMIGASEPNFQRPKTEFSLFPSGFPQGCLVEITGFGKTSVLAAFLKENSQFKVAWIERALSINPYSLLQHGVHLEKVLFIEAKTEIAWCLTQALQAGCFQVIVVSNEKFSEKDLRRYQLSTEKCASHFFLLNEDIHNSWAIALQLRTHRDKKKLQLEILKQRGV